MANILTQATAAVWQFILPIEITFDIDVAELKAQHEESSTIPWLDTLCDSPDECHSFRQGHNFHAPDIALKSWVEFQRTCQNTNSLYLASNNYTPYYDSRRLTSLRVMATLREYDSHITKLVDIQKTPLWRSTMMYTRMSLTASRT